MKSSVSPIERNSIRARLWKEREIMDMLYLEIFGFYNKNEFEYEFIECVSQGRTFPDSEAKTHTGGQMMRARPDTLRFHPFFRIRQ